MFVVSFANSREASWQVRKVERPEFRFSTAKLVLAKFLPFMDASRHGVPTFTKLSSNVSQKSPPALTGVNSKAIVKRKKASMFILKKVIADTEPF